MDELRKHQVSLRGASAKEITREALLDKVSHERELRSFNRRAAVAALFIQRVWRRYYLTKKVAMQLQEEWRAMIKHNVLSMTRSWVSNDLLRPFLFFITHSSIRHQKIQATDMDCMMTCFKILIESINSTESQKNFCSLATSTPEERKKWLYQAQRLISVCSSILSECDHTCPRDQDISHLTALAMRLAVALTDLKGWKNISDNIKDADAAVKELINFMATRKSGLYSCIRRYIMKLDGHVASRRSIDVPTDEIFLITASAITLALRPFNIAKLAANDTAPLNVKDAAELYCVHILTIPWLAQRLPAVLLPAVRHNCVLSPCLWVLHILKEKILTEMYKLDQSKCKSRPKVIPHVGWALANIINLATEFDSNSVCMGQFTQGLNCTFYVRVVSMYAENLLAWLENIGLVRKDNQNYLGNAATSGDSIYADVWESETTLVSSKMSFIDLLMPVHQQWHLLKLLALIKNDVFTQEMDASPQKEIVESFGMLGLIDIAYFYSHMLRIFSSLNHTGGSLPVLNMLSFTPGFLVNLWGELESLIPFVSHSAKGDKPCTSRNGKGDDRIFDRKQSQKVTTKDTGNRWITVLQKITLKSSTGFNYMHSINGEPRFNEFNENIGELWEIKPFRWGPQSISKDMSCLLHLFCATYSHLLLVLDDIEFYEKQTPFTLEQQRRIASVLNTLVYNGLSNNSGLQNLPLMDAAVRCLHFLYERDCRHQFCPSPLWLSPGLNNRPPIAAVVRTHEAALASFRSGDASASQSLGSIITTTPHVFPFEERVQMFREFIRLDKDSRGMAGALDTRSIEIVVRRGHIVEDGFKQLNYLGSKLKSCIHVSFISECGLPEAGLDYGGLSKEFLIEISKAAFSPEYGLFSQTSTSERLLIPNTAARSLENGIEMIEFLGRVVGKALYEGILLDYSFSLVFVQKLLGRYGFLDELSTLDPELYRNLIYVKNYDGDVKDLSLDFTVTEELLGRRVTIDLKPGGKDIAVTNDNKLQYVHAIADYKLNRQILPLADAFYRGLIDLISPSWLALFNASEFNQLLSGGNHDIDVNDLKNNTRYTGGYSEGSRTVKLFWGVISGFEPKERCMLLKFVTSCSRPPLLGFKHLQPTFTIHKVACDLPLWATIGGQDVDRLPSASTCYNTLKLPTYKRATTLRAKLLYAISSNAGFELS